MQTARTRTIRNGREVIVAPIVVLLLAVTLAACGGGGGSDQSAGTAASRAPSDQGLGANEGATRGGSTGSGSGSGAGSGEKPTGREPGARSRAVIYEADLRVETGDVPKSLAAAKDLTSKAGGYVGEEESRSKPPRAEIDLKIPAERYPAVLKRLTTELGTKLSLKQEAEDVTGEVADVAARVKSAEATLDRFRKLLDRASSVEEIINVENEIASRQADLEALQARQKSYEQDTAYATVSLTLVTPDREDDEKDDEPRGGFTDGLADGWDAFTTFISGLLMVLGWLLPFLVLFAAIGWPAAVIYRRLAARRSKEEAQNEARWPAPAVSGPPESSSGKPEGPDVPEKPDSGLQPPQ